MLRSTHEPTHSVPKVSIQFVFQILVDGEDSRPMAMNYSRLLKSSAQSDFKFLPWKLDHFEVIGKGGGEREGQRDRERERERERERDRERERERV